MVYVGASLNQKILAGSLKKNSENFSAKQIKKTRKQLVLFKKIKSLFI